MSKMDNLRAMREARYEKAAAAGRAAKAAKPAGSSPVAPPRKAAAAKPAPVGADDADPAAEARCGHRNMSGRTCTREQGHTAKSHRYS